MLCVEESFARISVYKYTSFLFVSLNSLIFTYYINNISSQSFGLRV